MSRVRLKTKYDSMGAYGSTEQKTLYYVYYNGSDTFSFYDEDGEVSSMFFADWSIDNNDKWDAMIRLHKSTYENLEEGVEPFYDELPNV